MLLESLPPIVTITVGYIFRAFLAYSCLIFIFPLASVYQERKIWASSSRIPSLSIIGCIKVYVFNVIWMGGTLFGALLLLPKWILSGMGRSVERDAHCLVERMTAILCISTFVGPVVVRGAEKLPPDVTPPGRPAPVYIANHASQIDVGAVYYLFRRFKWIAKKSVTYLPGVGQIMTLGGHVFIQRTGKNKGSISNLYAQSNEAVRSGIPMFLFPQGTRRMAQRLPFKDGAFNIALENESTIVPISIEVPTTAWSGLYPLSLLWGAKKDPVILTIHSPIPVTKGMDKAALKQRCFDTIYSVLPMYSDGGEDEGSGSKEKVS